MIFQVAGETFALTIEWFDAGAVVLIPLAVGTFFKESEPSVWKGLTAFILCIIATVLKEMLFHQLALTDLLQVLVLVAITQGAYSMFLKFPSHFAQQNLGRTDKVSLPKAA